MSTEFRNIEIQKENNDLNTCISKIYLTCTVSKTKTQLHDCSRGTEGSDINNCSGMLKPR